MKKMRKSWLSCGLLVAALAVGPVNGETVGLSDGPTGMDAATRQAAEATLARGVAWLTAQVDAHGRMGSNAHVAVTALALRAARGAAVGITNYELRITNGGGLKPKLEQAELFLKTFLTSNPTNGGMAAFNAEVCRNVLKLPPSQAELDWAKTWAAQDRDDSSRAREFELREIAWQKQRVELQKQGVDPERFAAASLAQAVAPTGRARPTDAPPGAASGLAALTKESGGSGGPALPGVVRGVGNGGLVAAALPKRIRRGYGSLTYDGMMRLLYDDVRGNDPRVDAMLDWAQRGWSLDDNPGKGQAGLFFFWHAMVKCLDASGEEAIVPLTGGTPIQWREEFVKKLIALQHVDQAQQTGYWVNANKSYMEDDPVLVTAYAMLSLERALGKK